jgi:uncharacterized iron-regulated membrane protein
MTIRSVFFWPHLVAGICAGFVILIMSFTGVLLTYERQVIAWSDSRYRSAPPSSTAARLSVEALLGQVRADHPELTPIGVTVASVPDAPAVVAVAQRALLVNAYTGAVLGESAPDVRRVLAEVRAWHRWLAFDGNARPIARAITGWSNAMFLLITASGLYLWFPRRWTWAQVRNVVLFKGSLRGKARDFNWHNVVGVWSAVPLFIVVLCAVPISFPWANAWVYRAVGEEPPPPAGGREAGPGRVGGPGRANGPGGRQQGPAPASLGGLDQLMVRAQEHVPGWRTVNLRIPVSPTALAVFTIDRGDGGQPQLRSTLTLDRRNGDVVAYEAFSDLTMGRRIRNVMRFAHTGEALGVPGQTIAGLASTGGVVLVYTGVALAWRRFRAWRRRRSERANSQPASARSTAA